jgi:hypothetical protein
MRLLLLLLQQLLLLHALHPQHRLGNNTSCLHRTTPTAAGHTPACSRLRSVSNYHTGSLLISLLL